MEAYGERRERGEKGETKKRLIGVQRLPETCVYKSKRRTRWSRKKQNSSGT